MKIFVDHPDGTYIVADSSLLNGGKPFFIPENGTRFLLSPCTVVKIDRVGKSIAERFAHRYYSQMAPGAVICNRDLLDSLRASGAPWTPAVAFDGCAPVGEFAPKEPQPCWDFHLKRAAEVHDLGGLQCDNQHLDKFIEKISRIFTLKVGDLIFLTTSQEFELNINDRVEASASEDKPALAFNIK